MAGGGSNQRKRRAARFSAEDTELRNGSEFHNSKRSIAGAGNSIKPSKLQSWLRLTSLVTATIKLTGTESGAVSVWGPPPPPGYNNSITVNTDRLHTGRSQHGMLLSTIFLILALLLFYCSFCFLSLAKVLAGGSRLTRSRPGTKVAARLKQCT